MRNERLGSTGVAEYAGGIFTIPDGFLVEDFPRFYSHDKYMKYRRILHDKREGKDRLMETVRVNRQIL